MKSCTGRFFLGPRVLLSFLSCLKMCQLITVLERWSFSLMLNHTVRILKAGVFSQLSLHGVLALRVCSQGDFPVQSLPFKLVLAFRRALREARRLRALVGRRARRTMRGERHTLMVESSLADNRSSWSVGLKATEFTTSSCCRRARQML